MPGNSASPATRLICKRNLLTLGPSALMSVLARNASATPLQMTFDVTAPPYNADQSGGTDATKSFQTALNQIAAYGRGVLKIPGGSYLLSGPLTCQGASITIEGDGQSSSILLIEHTATALSLTCASMGQSITIRDIGFSPLTGSKPAGVAIAVTFPNQPSGWPGLSIENVDIGIPQTGYSAFMGGLCLTNVWRANIHHVNMHSNIGIVANSYFIAMIGECVDLACTICNVDQIDVGILVKDYCEGLRLDRLVFYGNVGVSTGFSSYTGNGRTTPKINLLDLNIINSEINCIACALNLYQVNSGFISASHLNGSSAGVAVVRAYGCVAVQFSNCQITGEFNAAAPESFIGIAFYASDGWNSNLNTVDGCEFRNLSCGILYAAGAANNTVTSMRMASPSDGKLLTGSVKYGSITVLPAIDMSGNATNSTDAVSSTGSVHLTVPHQA